MKCGYGFAFHPSSDALESKLQLAHREDTLKRELLTILWRTNESCPVCRQHHSISEILFARSGMASVITRHTISRSTPA
jgi:hypothetical protein